MKAKCLAILSHTYFIHVLFNHCEIESRQFVFYSWGTCSGASLLLTALNLLVYSCFFLPASWNELNSQCTLSVSLQARTWTDTSHKPSYTHSIKPQGKGSSAHSRGKPTAVPMTSGAVMTSLHQISGTALDTMANQPRGVHLQAGRGAKASTHNQAELSVSKTHFQ